MTSPKVGTVTNPSSISGDTQNEVGPGAGEDAGAAVSGEGVERTLIRWFLTISPVERIRTVQNYIIFIEKIRRASDGS